MYKWVLDKAFLLIPAAVIQNCFPKKVFRNFAKLIGKHLCQSFFFNKIKKTLWHRYFPVNFVKFIRTPFFMEHLWWLLLLFIIKNKWKKLKISSQYPIPWYPIYLRGPKTLNRQFVTSVQCKPIFSGVSINFKSFVSHLCKFISRCIIAEVLFIL